MIKIADCDPKLRERIKSQIRAEDAAKSVARVADTERKPHAIPALVKGPKAQSGGKSRVVVHIVSFRRRESDLDNIISGAKPLRDAIARSLGCDDRDSRITWEYSTICTKGEPGTEVIISKING